MENEKNKSFTNVFLLEGDEKKAREYLKSLLEKSHGIHIDVENADINILDCSDLDTKRLKEILSGVIVKPRGSLKTYVFLNGEELSVIMQNAMLKTLEEPPEYAFFAIICKNAGSILPTLRSRCNYMYTGCFEEDYSGVQTENVAIIEHIYELSIGSLFQEIKTISKRETALNFIKDYLKYLDKVDKSYEKKIIDTRLEIVLVLEKARVLIEGNSNCSASMEAMALNIMEVLSDYSSRNKI